MDPLVVKKRLAELERRAGEMQKLIEAYRMVQDDLGASPDDVASVPVLDERVARDAAGDSDSQNGNEATNTDIVRSAIKAIGGPFTFRDVYTKTLEMGGGLSKLQVSRTIHRLQRFQKISVSRHGVGRQPTMYRAGVVE